MTTKERLKYLLNRMEVDPYFAKLSEAYLEDFWARFSEDEQAKILEYISFLIPPAKRIDNGDGTYTYIFTPYTEQQR